MSSVQWPSAGKQIVRVSSPEATLAALGTDINTYGQAYKSGYHQADFLYDCTGNSATDNGDGVALTHLPLSTTSWLLLHHASSMTITGIPAVYALVGISDTYAGS